MALPAKPERYQPKHKVRFVTAAALFDGHDAAINIIRRLLQAHGAEVIHLGHNRSVAEIVDAAIQEDAQAIAVSSYQGGHIEFFTYMIDLLRQRGAGHVKVFGGGGGVIVPREIAELEAYGVAKIFSPEDGRALGLDGMIEHMIEAADFDPASARSSGPARRHLRPLARRGPRHHPRRGGPRGRACRRPATPHRSSASPAPAARASPRSPTSWCGASSPTSRRSRIAILAVDPTKRAPAAPCSATASA